MEPVRVNPLLDEIERWQSIYDWFAAQDKLRATNEAEPRIKRFKAEATKVEGFLRHMIASTNISAPPSNPPETKRKD